MLNLLALNGKFPNNLIEILIQIWNLSANNIIKMNICLFYICSNFKTLTCMTRISRLVFTFEGQMALETCIFKSSNSSGFIQI